jgi:AAA15 family ATPase/GTPase
MEWVRNTFSVITNEESYEGFSYRKMTDNEAYREDILRFLKVADTGIEDIFTESATPEDLPNHLPEKLRNKLISPERKRLVFQHSIFNAEGKTAGKRSWGQHNESAGTQKLFALSVPLIETLQTGGVLVIDELDAKLHPMIMRFILGLFHSKSHNPHDAQLIFAAHDTQLLSPRFFRRDQIWFTEKDPYGATDLYSLADFDLDDQADFSRDYFQGQYSAVPVIGDLHLFYEGAEHGER